jgi:arsenate reductase-like glutaredoxin family protein
MSIVIHDNPDCGTSRNVLAIIEASGETPMNIGPKRFHQNRIVSWQMSMPRSNSKSSI